MTNTVKKIGYLAGAAIAGNVVMAAGIVIREANIKKQKEMLTKLISAKNRIDAIKNIVEQFTVATIEDSKYLMESETYKTLLNDGYIAEKIAYYIIGSEDLINEELKKNIKPETERLYKLYVKGDKTEMSVINYREKVQAEINELKKKAK